jgi:hypothetical protein
MADERGNRVVTLTLRDTLPNQPTPVSGRTPETADIFRR